MISLTDYGFGPKARNQLPAAADPSPAGAVAALETFYYALNHRDIDAMTAVWSPHELAQLNNPVGGLLRGGPEAVALYARIFDSGTHLEVTFVACRIHAQIVYANTCGVVVRTHSIVREGQRRRRHLPTAHHRRLRRPGDRHLLLRRRTSDVTGDPHQPRLRLRRDRRTLGPTPPPRQHRQP